MAYAMFLMAALACCLTLLIGCGARNGWSNSKQTRQAAWAADPYEKRGYSMDDRPTERQVQITRDLIEEANYRDSGADRVLAGEGWPSERLFDFITHAETALDRMRERYGVEFRALNGGYVLPGVGYSYYEFRVAATEGPLEGEECSYTYRSPDQAKGPAEESDTYIDLLRRDEYTDYVLAAVNRAFDMHPDVHGAFAVTTVGNHGLWADIPKPNAPIGSVAKYLSGKVAIYLYPESAVNREEYDSFNRDIGELLLKKTTDVNYELVVIRKLTDSYLDKPFSFNAGYAARSAGYKDGSYIKWDTRVSVTSYGKIYWGDGND